MKKENRSTEIACQNSCRFSPTTLELCAKTYAHFILSYAVQHTALFTMSLHIIYTRELPAWNCMNENTFTQTHVCVCLLHTSVCTRTSMYTYIRTEFTHINMLYPYAFTTKQRIFYRILRHPRLLLKRSSVDSMLNVDQITASKNRCNPANERTFQHTH